MAAKSTGAATATPMLLIRQNEAIVATSAPSMPPIVVAAIAVGTKEHIMAPWASSGFTRHSTR